MHTEQSVLAKRNFMHSTKLRNFHLFILLIVIMLRWKGRWWVQQHLHKMVYYVRIPAWRPKPSHVHSWLEKYNFTKIKLLKKQINTNMSWNERQLSIYCHNQLSPTLISKWINEILDRILKISRGWDFSFSHSLVLSSFQGQNT